MAKDKAEPKTRKAPVRNPITKLFAEKSRLERSLHLTRSAEHEETIRHAGAMQRIRSDKEEKTTRLAEIQAELDKQPELL